MNWDLETQHTVGYAMMATGAALLPLILIWAISEWFGHPTWKDCATLGPVILMACGMSILVYALRLT